MCVIPTRVYLRVCYSLRLFSPCVLLSPAGLLRVCYSCYALRVCYSCYALRVGLTLSRFITPVGLTLSRFITPVGILLPALVPWWVFLPPALVPCERGVHNVDNPPSVDVRGVHNVDNPPSIPGEQWLKSYNPATESRVAQGYVLYSTPRFTVGRHSPITLTVTTLLTRGYSRGIPHSLNIPDIPGRTNVAGLLFPGCENWLSWPLWEPPENKPLPVRKQSRNVQQSRYRKDLCTRKSGIRRALFP